MPVSGIVLTRVAASVENTALRLAKVSGVEIHGVLPNGKIVAVIEAPSPHPHPPGGGRYLTRGKHGCLNSPFSPQPWRMKVRRGTILPPPSLLQISANLKGEISERRR